MNWFIMIIITIIIIIINVIVIISAASPIACSAARLEEGFCPVRSGLEEPAEARADPPLPVVPLWNKLWFSSKTLFP